METRVGQRWRRADYEEPQIQCNIQRSVTIYKFFKIYKLLRKHFVFVTFKELLIEIVE